VAERVGLLMQYAAHKILPRCFQSNRAVFPSKYPREGRKGKKTKIDTRTLISYENFS